MKTLYEPTKDAQFQKPYVDVNEWRGQEGYRYVHGGFEGTELRFSFFYPIKEAYTGRFFQYLPPVQGHEDAGIGRTGMEDRIGFAISHGAYHVESNMGAKPFAPLTDPTIIYRASAAAAEYSRKIARELYGEHRPYGYVYGGSGGSYKTISCIENTAVWDGAAPYVNGTSYSIPYTFTLRIHAKRVLRRVLPLIADHVEPGGISKEELYEKLTEEEREALEETIRFGFPLRDWFMYREMDDGSLPIFIQMLKAFDPAYYEDFWTKEGYLGTDETHSAIRDRIKFEANVLELHVPGAGARDNSKLTGVDDAWLRNRVELDGKAWIRIDQKFASDAYLHGMQVIFKSGAAKEYRVSLVEAHGDTAVIEPFFGAVDFLEKFGSVKEGDTVSFDNSDAIALQSYQRHQVPKEGYPAWNVYRNADGTPKYPQREQHYGPKVAYGGCGNLQSGEIRDCKVIVTAGLMDESALPWMQDWYRGKVKEACGDDASCYRLWYVDHALHGDTEKTPDDLHLVNYLGVLYSALLGVSDWVERGIVPQESTVYTVNEGLVTVPPTAAQRKGVQPVVRLTANGGKCVRVRTGESVQFAVDVQLPAGELESMEWSFAGEPYHAGGQTRTHYYPAAGTYFAVARATANLRRGDRFTKIYNLDRVRVIVED